MRCRILSVLLPDSWLFEGVSRLRSSLLVGGVMDLFLYRHQLVQKVVGFEVHRVWLFWYVLFLIVSVDLYLVCVMENVHQIFPFLLKFCQLLHFDPVEETDALALIPFFLELFSPLSRFPTGTGPTKGHKLYLVNGLVPCFVIISHKGADTFLLRDSAWRSEHLCFVEQSEGRLGWPVGPRLAFGALTYLFSVADCSQKFWNIVCGLTHNILYRMSAQSQYYLE